VAVTIDDPVLPNNEVNTRYGENSEIADSFRTILINRSLQGAK